MPKIIIPNMDLLPLIRDGKMDVGFNQTTIEIEDTGPVSDGFHSFNELYKHRNLLYCMFLHAMSDKARSVFRPWKSWLHNDGTAEPGFFISGLTVPDPGSDLLIVGDISYHLPSDLWKYCRAKTLSLGKSWDGHSSQDVVERMQSYMEKSIKEMQDREFQRLLRQS